MKHLVFKEFEWPKGLNLEVLAGVLSEDDLGKLIADSMIKTRAERRIILPSLSCVRKIQAHAIWKKILSGFLTWEKFKKDIQKEHGNMLMVGIRKDKVIELYEQREKEIIQEKK